MADVPKIFSEQEEQGFLAFLENVGSGDLDNIAAVVRMARREGETDTRLRHRMCSLILPPKPIPTPVPSPTLSTEDFVRRMRARRGVGEPTYYTPESWLTRAECSTGPDLDLVAWEIDPELKRNPKNDGSMFDRFEPETDAAFRDRVLMRLGDSIAALHEHGVQEALRLFAGGIRVHPISREDLEKVESQYANTFKPEFMGTFQSAGPVECSTCRGSGFGGRHYDGACLDCEGSGVARPEEWRVHPIDPRFEYNGEKTRERVVEPYEDALVRRKI